MKTYYSKESIERFLNPKFFGEMKNPDGVGKVGNKRCGDEMEIYISVKKGRITGASFRTLGCAAAIATSDIICEMVVGKKPEEAVSLTEKEMVKKLEYLPNTKVHCASLALEGLKAAVDDYNKKK